MKALKILSLAAILTISLAGTAAAQSPATLTAIHGIPGLPQPVDVYVNNDYLFSFDFAEDFGPAELPAGQYDIKVNLGAVTVLGASVDLAEGENYTLIAHLDGIGSPTLTPFVNDDSVLRSSDARLTVRHTAEAPTVDVKLDTIATFTPVPASVTIPGLANSRQIGPIEVSRGVYTASLLVEGTPVYGSDDLLLNGGISYIVYAIGSYPDTFQLFIQTIAPSERTIDSLEFR